MDTVFALWIIANSGQAKEYRAEGGEEPVAPRRGPARRTILLVPIGPNAFPKVQLLATVTM